MSSDAYAPCPCGGGKKLKFCCAGIVDEMTKVMRLRASDQLRPALQILEKLEKSNPDNPWVATSQAEILLSMHEMAAAKTRLEKILKTHPDHPAATTDLALAILLSEGYPAARPAIQRAFQKCANRASDHMGQLALSAAVMLQTEHHHMAARQYLSLAIRNLGEESREETFALLAELDGDPEIPYAMRSVHNLGPSPSNGPRAADASKAQSLSNIGCWGPAARLFTKIAEQEPQTADLWRNAALCRAWDADEAGAAEAFHRAARSADDNAQAVECETLAQLCEWRSPGNLTTERVVSYPIQSASRLLTRLEGQERIQRTIEEKDEDEADEQPVAGSFVILDKPLPAGSTDLAMETIPVAAASLRVYDGVPEKALGAVAVLHGNADERFESARELFESVAADELSGPSTVQEVGGDDWLPAAYREAARRFVFPPGTLPSVRLGLRAEWSRHYIDDVWFSTPQSALGNRTPLSAKDDPAYRIPLAAAVYVLDALAQRFEFRLDPDALLRRLGLDPIGPLEVDSKTNLSSLSAMQLHRLPVSRLSDAQLVYVHRRAMLIGHRRFVHEVLKEILSRPECAERIDINRAYRTLIRVARDEGRFSDALAWVLEAKERASKEAKPFVPVLNWLLLEFSLRTEQPDDPELQHVFRRLADYYAPKVPDVARLLEAFRATYSARYPWLGTTESLVTSDAAAATTPGGIWTPDAASATPASGKLWLPGQE